jgi:transcriptional regulator GlxA family with amidase domain
MAHPRLKRRTANNLEDRRINWDAFRYYPSLNRILAYWSDNPGEAISVSEAASLAAMTRAYFSRFFHEKTGVTFKHWIDFMRVKHATSLLGTEDMTMIQLAEGCGFHDSTTFTRTFKRITGHTPLQFKRMLQAV